MNKELMAQIDHIDIVTTHKCNMRCSNCIDKFVRTSNDVISIEIVDKFLKRLYGHIAVDTSVLMLGGEPTTLSFEELQGLVRIIHKYGLKNSF